MSEGGELAVPIQGHRHSPIRLSWTGLTRWEECRMKDHLHREKKTAPLLMRDGRIFLPGTTADLTMRYWLEGEDHSPGSLAKGVKGVLDSLVENPERPLVWKNSDKDADIASILADVETGLTRLEPWLRENVLPYDYQPEARGYGTVGIPDVDDTVHRVELVVAVDIAVRRPNGKLRLYDLKFTRNKDYVRGKTLGQLSFYKIGWAAMSGVPLSDIEELAFITPMTPILETPVRPDKEDLRVMMSRITSYAQGVWSGNHPTKKAIDSNCTYRCEVKNACPLFSTVDAGKGKVSMTKTAALRKATRKHANGE